MPPIAFSGAVEGVVDEAVFKRLVGDLHCHQGPVYGKKGKDFLRTRITAYNAAAQFSQWMVLVDLDEDFRCAGELRNDWLPHPAQMMCFRVVVRAIESWLLADSERFSRYFGVAQRQIPDNLERELHPKIALISVIGHSRRREIREDMLPRFGSGRDVGPAYTSRLIGFASDTENGWRPTIAATKCESLGRCIRCMRTQIRQAR